MSDGRMRTRGAVRLADGMLQGPRSECGGDAAAGIGLALKLQTCATHRQAPQYLDCTSERLPSPKGVVALYPPFLTEVTCISGRTFLEDRPLAETKLHQRTDEALDSPTGFLRGP